jgi:hypothetical protein
MIAIDDILISDDVVSEHFVCNLVKCRGACCVEGDGGAPLEREELPVLDEIYDKLEPFLADDGIEAIRERGRYVFEKDDEYTGYGTPLIGDTGACAYRVINDNGVAACGIEKAWEAGAVEFRKPISCHLYPIRIKEYETMTAVNYEVWDICDAACALGDELKVPAYRFVKEGLIRKFGEEFYQRLEGSAAYMTRNEQRSNR